MAVEAKRGCGYRKKGGIYLVSDKLTAPCDRLPMPMEVCPCCGAGVKPARGWTWIDPIKLFGTHSDCKDDWYCPVCNPSRYFMDFTMNEHGVPVYLPNKKAGLLWIGDKFYSPSEFIIEAEQLGVSRRISALPRGFKVGETWVFLAHSKACHRWNTDKVLDGGQIGDIEAYPGIVTAFIPKRIDYIVDGSEYDIWKFISEDPEAEYGNLQEDGRPRHPESAFEIFEKLQRAVDRGMTLVPVPDDDPDHH